MAFSFAHQNTGAVGGAGDGQVTAGPDLELIQTEGLGFLSVAGETKLQFVSKWTEPPLSTASLVSIASHKGLIAAAGPDAVHVAPTDAVRSALTAEGDGDSDIRPFSAPVRIPMPFRVSQLAFTADETYLVLSAETGGGLAVYEVQALLAQGGSAKPAFELSTNGEPLRSLVPNPMADKAELCALVTTNGNLLMADLTQRTLRNTASGQPVLRAHVSCAAWSSKGKQLVAGCADGSVYQMTPDGQEKAHIPKPPQIAGDFYVASLSWLENDVFLVVHNPNALGSPSVYHIVTRNTKTAPAFVYQKLNDPVEPFGDKAPHHTILRLRDFPPNLQDMLLVASTAVENIGLLTRSKTPLTSSAPADKITNVFTTTELADDSRRAQLPMSADYNDTFPIGVALDLSGKEKVPKPIPTDEIDESPGPLPGLSVLNNEGVLISWWIVYNDSIRQGTTFPGLVAVEGGGSSASIGGGNDSSMKVAAATSGFSATAFGNSSSAPAPTPAPASTPAAPAFGKPAFGAPAFGAPAFGAPAFGSPSAAPAPRAPAFGAPSTLGSGSAFGSPSALGSGSGFGAAGALGNRQSVWGAGGKSAATPAFGQTAFGSAAPPASSGAPAAASGGGFSAFANKPSPFGSAATPSEKPAFGSGSSGASPFGAFSNNGQSAFASLGASKPSSGSIFGSATSSESKPFGSFGGGSSVFGAPSTTAEAQPADKPASNPFGSSPFVLGTTFKPDPASAKDNETTPQKDGGGSLFGSGFGLSLEAAKKEPAKAETKDEDMDATPPPAAAAAPAQPEQTSSSTAGAAESTTPTTTPGATGSRYFDPLTSSDNKTGLTSAPSLFSKPFGAAAPGTTTSLFGKPSGTTAPSLFGKPLGDASSTAPANPFAAKPGGLFGSLAKDGAKPATDDAKKAAAEEAGPSEEAPQDRTKENTLPLPPDTISKAAFLFEDSSSSSSSSAHTVPSPRMQPVSSNHVAEEDAGAGKADPRQSPAPKEEPAVGPEKETDAAAAAAREATPPPAAEAKAKEAATDAKPPAANPLFGQAFAASASKPFDFKDKSKPFSFADTKAKETTADAKPPAANPFGPAVSAGGAKPFDFKDTKKPFDFKDTKAKPFDFKDTKPKSYYPLFASTPTPSQDPAMHNPFANLAKGPVSATTDDSDDSDEGSEENGEEAEAEDDAEEGEGEIVEGEYESEEGDEEEEEDGGEDEDNDEGSGTDVCKDLSRSPTGLVQTPSFSARGESSFATLGTATDASGTLGSFTQVEAPRSQLFGGQQAAPALQAPRAPLATSPRSPSPQRRPLAKAPGGVGGPGAGAAAGRLLLREDAQRSFSAPSMASQILRASSRQQGGGPVAGAGGIGSGAGGLFASRRVPRDTNVEEQRKADAARAAAEAEAREQEVPEDSYDAMDRELDQPLAPTRQLAECLYLLDSDVAGGDTVPSQVEAVYRDINRMVLVLKVNSRNIDAFLRGHERAAGQARKSEDDLETADGWVLCDVDDLGAIVSRDLPSKLRRARVQGEEALVAEAAALLRDGSRLQVLHADMVRVLAAQTAGAGRAAAAARSLPLSAEQATQQSEVRRAFAAFVAQLAEAEQQLVLLRAKMASAAAATATGADGSGGGGSGGGSNGRAAPVPTVDAVLRTIARMTAMAEKRSGDIDVLEAQVRKMNLGGSSLGSHSHSHSHSHSRSREGSPFSTPKHQKRASLVFAPGSSAQKRASGLFGAAAAAAASPGTLSSAAGTPTRRKLGGYTDEEKAQLRQKKAGRQRTLERLQKMQQAEGPRYMGMD